MPAREPMEHPQRHRRRRIRRAAQAAHRHTGGETTATEATSNTPKRGGRLQLFCWSLTVALSLMLIAAIEGVAVDLSKMQAKSSAAQSELEALTAQQRVGRTRLAALESRRGREAVLLEHGYIKPGERILLFPAQPQDAEQGDVGRNDLVRHAGSDQDASDLGQSPPSLWRSGGHTVIKWWRALRGTIKPQ